MAVDMAGRHRRVIRRLILRQRRSVAVIMPATVRNDCFRNLGLRVTVITAAGMATVIMQRSISPDEQPARQNAQIEEPASQHEKRPP